MARRKAGPRARKNNPGLAARKAGTHQRPHFGVGDLLIVPEKSVFINCPFDADYAELFDAIVFATTSCGFLARSALESGTVAEPRMTRIARALLSSKYSIHDLSRCTGQGGENFARFNMPLELGIAMGRRISEGENSHDWLILVPQGHGYLQFASDLGGFDLKTHNGSVEQVVRRIIGWLATRKDAVWIPDPEQVIEALPNFQQRKAALLQQWGEQDVPWADIILAARDCVPQ